MTGPTMLKHYFICLGSISILVMPLFSNAMSRYYDTFFVVTNDTKHMLNFSVGDASSCHEFKSGEFFGDSGDSEGGRVPILDL